MALNRSYNRFRQERIIIEQALSGHLAFLQDAINDMDSDADRIRNLPSDDPDVREWKKLLPFWTRQFKITCEILKREYGWSDDEIRKELGGS
ncbi:hypothetical protein GCM10010869_16550 [Mesorhizobium tianshanense]|uniref:Uncharacterized protein n=1 Tax=Mesorhizobium tianshanense TaxID=39844 RepID=A0A562NVZ7_9HYPH|nr:hypothetical protein [Mesorhizobium tianshanense]TWI36394.1 hypothetical protein IQ26_02907 [Mesorhizobium tianshanense]GLS36066.1 hypothetical protein GCM10010869_16550 [Mesorhizobium tianshanense]